jgi:membrane protein required for colicin V production
MPILDDFYVLDVAVAGVVFLSAWVAYMRGLVREVFSLGTWIGSVAVTLYFYPQASQFARQHIESDFAADLAAGVALFAGSFFLLRMIGSAIAESIAKSEQNTLDRSAGFLFGLFRGGLLVVVAYMAFTWFVPEEEQPGWMADAKVTPMLREGTRKLTEFLPSSLTGDAESEAARLRALDRQAAELERLRKGFNQPAPSVPESSAKPVREGYNDETRQGVESLLRAAREAGHDGSNQ